MMDTETWDEAVAVVIRRIAIWQEAIERRGLSAKLSLIVSAREGRSALLLRYADSARQVSARCIMRFEASDSIFPCIWRPRQQKWCPKPAPHQWLRMDAAPADQIWRALRANSMLIAIIAGADIDSPIALEPAS